LEGKYLTQFEELLAEEEDTQHGRFLTFTVGSEIFGLEIKYVTEIVGMQPITPLPEAPEYMKGIINLRGKIIPVIDIRLKFKKELREYTDRTCIIVIEIGDSTTGLIVDNVSEVQAINDDAIAPPPDRRAGLQNKYIAGIGKVENDVILLLSCEKLFAEDEIHQLTEDVL
jgi:Chemotaxis signal transduction protein